MDYQISLGFYEGTIEPLHSLVRKSEVDIIDVPLGQILQGYFRWIGSHGQVDLDAVGDFLVIAAHLLLTKVRTLLPLKHVEEEEEIAGEDSLEIGLSSGILQQYKTFKSFAKELGTKEGEVLQRYSRPSSFLDFEDDGEEAPLSELLKALKNVIDRAASSSSYEISAEQMDLGLKIREILELLGSKGKILFEELFGDQTSRVEIIITFIAILELVRLQKALVRQTKIFDDIWVHARN